jgi:hypothetical protein
MGNTESSVEWNILEHGEFVDSFMNSNFTKGERVSSMCTEFRDVLKYELQETSHSLKVRKVFAQIVLSRDLSCFDAVLLKNADHNMFQTFVFQGERRRTEDGMPLIHINYGVTPELKAAEANLRKCKEVEVMTCSNSIFSAIQKHVMKYSNVKDLISVTSGIQQYEGLVPCMVPKRRSPD